MPEAEQLNPWAEAGLPRPLYVIAGDIKRHWPKVWFGAVPYLEAMAELDSIDDKYGPGRESARMIVSYFLGNAKLWRGEDAKRIKAELKAMIGQK